MDSETALEIEHDDSLVSLTADIVAAHVSNNSVLAADLPVLIQTVHGALAGLNGQGLVDASRNAPAVPVKASVKPDFLICLEDGRKLKMLRRYLQTRYGMTPEQYRTKWGLPHDYPMVAPNYADQRRDLAKKIGLGTPRNVKRS